LQPLPCFTPNEQAVYHLVSVSRVFRHRVRNSLVDSCRQSDPAELRLELLSISSVIARLLGSPFDEALEEMQASIDDLWAGKVIPAEDVPAEMRHILVEKQSQ
jgi:hypothetical protein